MIKLYCSRCKCQTLWEIEYRIANLIYLICSECKNHKAITKKQYSNMGGTG